MTGLCDLANQYKTDKCDVWNYTPIYYDWLSPMRERARTVLEVGVYRGASLRMWRDFFPNAMVYGVEIQQAYMVEGEDRIKTFHGDAYDPSTMAEIMKEVGEVDLFVDDAVHWTPPQAELLRANFRYLRQGGIYAIEEALTNNLPAIWEVCAVFLNEIRRLYVWHAKDGYHLVLIEKGPK